MSGRQSGPSSIPIPRAASNPAHAIDNFIPLSISPTYTRARLPSSGSQHDPRRASLGRTGGLISASISPARSVSHFHNSPAAARVFHPRVVRADPSRSPENAVQQQRARRMSTTSGVGVGVRGTSASRSSLYPPAPYVRPSYLSHSSFRQLLVDEAPRGRPDDYAMVTEPISTGSLRRISSPSEDSEDDESSSSPPPPEPLPSLASTSTASPDSPQLTLPTRWGEAPRQTHLSVSQDGRELSFQGPQSSTTDKKEASSARTNHPVPAACGIYYYEVEIVNKGVANKGHISVGFIGRNVRLTRLPGWEKHSWGYHADTGCCTANERDGSPFGPICGTGDVLGCGIDFTQNRAFYTRNGTLLGYVFEGIGKECEVFPSVGLRHPGEAIRANFGHEPFKYDIDYLVQQQQHKTWTKIMSTPMDTTRIAGSPHDETFTTTARPWPNVVPVEGLREPFHKLVMSYLEHHGHARTARKLREQCESANMNDPWVIEPITGDVNMDSLPSVRTPSASDAAVIRTRIVDSVTKGNIDTALEYTQNQFPVVLEADEGLMLFKLKCRKFIELILGTAELKKKMDRLLASGASELEVKQTIAPSSSSSTSAGQRYGDGIMNDMDIDDDEDPSPTPIPPSGSTSQNGFSNGSAPAARATSPRRPRTDAENEAVASYEASLKQALSYGQSVQKDYSKDKREEVKKHFKRTFSVVAYADPLSAGPEIVAIAGQEARAALANELNRAILKSQDLPVHPPLETLYRKTAATLLQAGLLGAGAAAFADIQKELLEG